MARIIVNKYHLITMGLWSKHLNNEPVYFTEQEFETFAQAYQSDPRRPITDFMNNIYDHDFKNVTFGDMDLIYYDQNTKTYTPRTNVMTDLLSKYMSKDEYNHPITNQLFNYMEILGKNRLYVKREDQNTL